MVKLMGFDKKAQASEWVRKTTNKIVKFRKDYHLPMKDITKFKIKKYMDKKRKKPVYVVSN